MHPDTAIVVDRIETAMKRLAEWGADFHHPQFGVTCGVCMKSAMDHNPLDDSWHSNEYCPVVMARKLYPNG